MGAPTMVQIPVLTIILGPNFYFLGSIVFGFEGIEAFLMGCLDQAQVFFLGENKAQVCLLELSSMRLCQNRRQQTLLCPGPKFGLQTQPKISARTGYGFLSTGWFCRPGGARLMFSIKFYKHTKNLDINIRQISENCCIFEQLKCKKPALLQTHYIRQI